MWICPACRLPLCRYDQQWQCDNRHSYDIAKEGHVNLLLANQKNSRDPGDNKDMINARRAFLQAGYYQPLAEQLVTFIRQYHSKPELELYDAGCGEGYYLNFVSQSLHQYGVSIDAWGSDISKVAIQKAAKKYPQAGFAVASSFNLPLAGHCVDVVLQVFAPLDSAEVKRILRPDGIWLQVNPHSGHLWQLKQALYQQPEPFIVEPTLPAGFDLLDQDTVKFQIAITDAQQRQNLLKMTPYFWSTPADKRDQVLLALACVNIEFNIKVLRKSEGVE
ncbi:putative RNA methyltransferase [Neptunicella sp. SCSIO 80796]|uniref:putative RNA methyltransferase n=1 Tax=Neptunicella plasticusilytica TaxID=3117012 RepID=UPI003A4DF93C